MAQNCFADSVMHGCRADGTAEWFGDSCLDILHLKTFRSNNRRPSESSKTVFRRPERCCGGWRRACFDSMGERWPVPP